MPAYSRKKFARALVLMMPNHSVQDIAKAAAQEIITQRWMRDIDVILRDVSAELLAERKHLNAEVTTAHDISKELRQSITEFLTERYEANNVSILEKVNPSIIGGFLIETPNEQIDASIKTKLTTLKYHV
jgi:F-type H+-transporting ATPase subunit delta